MIWENYGQDGLPIMPNANPGCTTCEGFGVVDCGDMCRILVACPTCVDVDNEIDYEELGCGE